MSEKALVSQRERRLEALCRAAASLASECPIWSPHLFISTGCFGSAGFAFLLLGQNTWEKLVKEGGACFVFQLEGGYSPLWQESGGPECETSGSPASPVGK